MAIRGLSGWGPCGNELMRWCCSWWFVNLVVFTVLLSGMICIAFGGDLKLTDIDTRENPSLYDRNFPFGTDETDPDKVTTPGEGDYDQSLLFCDVTVVWLLDMSENLESVNEDILQNKMIDLVVNVSNVFGFGPDASDAKGMAIIYGLDQILETNIAASTQQFNTILNDVIGGIDPSSRRNLTGNNVHDAIMRLEEIIGDLPNGNVVPIVMTHGDLDDKSPLCDDKNFVYPNDQNLYEGPSRGALCIRMSMFSLLSDKALNNYAEYDLENNGPASPDDRIVHVFHMPFEKVPDAILSPIHFRYFRDARFNNSITVFNEEDERLSLDELFNDGNFTKLFIDKVFSKVDGCSPTARPTTNPTILPTRSPSATPSAAPTESPTTASPTISPTSSPTNAPSISPTRNPTTSPTTSQPSKSPTFGPTKDPTSAPTYSPTSSPTLDCIVEPEVDSHLVATGLFLFVYLVMEMVFFLRKCTGMDLLRGSKIWCESTIWFGVLVFSTIVTTLCALILKWNTKEINYCGANERSLAVVCDHRNNPYVLVLLFMVPAQMYFLSRGFFGKFQKVPFEVRRIGVKTLYDSITFRYTRAAAVAMKKCDLPLEPIERRESLERCQDLEGKLLDLAIDSEKVYKSFNASSGRFTETEKLKQDFHELTRIWNDATQIMGHKDELVLHKKDEEYTDTVFKWALLVESVCTIALSYSLFFLLYETDDEELCLAEKENKLLLGIGGAILSFYAGTVLLNPFEVFLPSFKAKVRGVMFVERWLWIVLLKITTTLVVGIGLFVVLCVIFFLLVIPIILLLSRLKLHHRPGIEWVYLIVGVALLVGWCIFLFQVDFGWVEVIFLVLGFVFQVVALVVRQSTAVWVPELPYWYSGFIVLSFMIPLVWYWSQSIEVPALDITGSLQSLTFLSICTLSESLNSIFRSTKTEEDGFWKNLWDLITTDLPLWIHKAICRSKNPSDPVSSSEPSDGDDECTECRAARDPENSSQGFCNCRCKKCGKPSRFSDEHREDQRCTCNRGYKRFELFGYKRFELFILGCQGLNWIISTLKILFTVLAVHALLVGASSPAELGLAVFAIIIGLSLSIVLALVNFWHETRSSEVPPGVPVLDPRSCWFKLFTWVCCGYNKNKDQEEPNTTNRSSVSPAPN